MQPRVVSACAGFLSAVRSRLRTALLHGPTADWTNALACEAGEHAGPETTGEFIMQTAPHIVVQ